MTVSTHSCYSRVSPGSRVFDTPPFVHMQYPPAHAVCLIVGRGGDKGVSGPACVVQAPGEGLTVYSGVVICICGGFDTGGAQRSELLLP